MAKKNLNKKVGKKNNTPNKGKDMFYGQEDQYYLLQTLIDNIPDHIYIKDKKSRFIIVNKTTADSMKKKPEDFIGKTDFDFFSKEHAKQAFKDEQKVIKTCKSIIDFEEKETFKDKEDRWASTSKIPWYDEKGNIMGTMGISRDITKRKEAADVFEEAFGNYLGWQIYRHLG